MKDNDWSRERGGAGRGPALGDKVTKKLKISYDA